MLKLINAKKKPLIFMGVLLFLAGSAFAVYYVGFAYPRGSVPTKQNLPPVISQTLEPTDLDVTLNTFGPWASPEIDENGHPVTDQGAILLLKEDGGMLVSTRWALRSARTMWEKAAPPEISKLSVERNNVRMITNTRREFRFQTYQPFLIEQTPKIIYSVDELGAIYMVNFEKALGIRYQLFMPIPRLDP